LRRGRRRRSYEQLSHTAYTAEFAKLPEAVRTAVEDRWGKPQDDPHVIDGTFRLALHRFGNQVVGIQPARGYNIDPKETYHDPDLVPPHHYFAFYIWLRREFGADAVIHLGKHGNLEWLPGKALALSEDCFPEAVLGPMPNIYPFIVNDPGEGAQAKRRTSAVIVDHLTPPLTRAESHGVAEELETLLDEYYLASGVDPRRLKALTRDILDVASRHGLDKDIGITDEMDKDTRLARLDAHLCDLKELQIRDGLHILGESPEGGLLTDLLSALVRVPRGGEARQNSLQRALSEDLGFAPGPSGAPSRGRPDVLPTGKNFYSVDVRAVPTETAWRLGQQSASLVAERYFQEEGEWPASLVLTCWGTANMRTGGDDLAQALALIGAARPGTPRRAA
jgi:cobaltochelatase CobN